MSELTGNLTTTTATTANLTETTDLTANVGDNSKPVASNLAIIGVLGSGNLLIGTYDYTDADSDAEAGTTFKWYRADDEVGTNKTLIAGEVSTGYTQTDDDIEKYLYFEVTPGAATGERLGIAVTKVSGQVPASYEDESVTIFEAMTTEPDDARKTLIDAWVVAGKAHGWWAKGEWFAHVCCSC